MKPFFLMLMLALAGCAHHGNAGTTVKKILAVGGDVMQCAPGEAQSVQQALLHGGWDWLTVVVDALACVPEVVKDLQAPPPGAEVKVAMAGSAPIPLPHGLTKRQRERIATARVLSEIVLNRVQP